ncbi:hypothetical protein BH10PSE19_BH10PSE19_04280 [soil metagenome]
MKKIGIILPTGLELSYAEQSGAFFISSIISAILMHPDLELTVASRSTFKESIEQLIKKLNTTHKNVNYIISDEPYLLSLEKKWHKTKSKTHTKKSPLREYVIALIQKFSPVKKAQKINSFLLKLLIQQQNPFVFFLLASIYAIVAVVISPIFLCLFVVKKWAYLKNWLQRVIYYLKRKITRVFPSNIPSPLPFYEFKSSFLKSYDNIHQLAHTYEMKQLVNKINEYNKIDLWFSSELLNREWLNINGKTIILISDHYALNNNFHELLCENLNRVDFFITNNAKVKQSLINKRILSNEKKCFIIPDGHYDLISYLQSSNKINVSAANQLTQSALKILKNYQQLELQQNLYLRDFCFAEVPFIFYPFGLIKDKYVLNLVRAIEILIRKRYENIKLIITIDLNQNKELLNYIRKKKLNYDIIILEKCDAKLLAALTQLARVVVSFNENLTTFISEAHSIGTPALINKTAETLEKIQDKELRANMLFESVNVSELVTKLQWAIRNRDGLYQQQQLLYSTVTKRDWDTVTKEYLEVFSQVTG